MADPVQHFTAVVEISRVRPEQSVASGYQDRDTRVVPREVHEVARVVLRDADMTTLLTRTTKHLDLLAATEGAD